MRNVRSRPSPQHPEAQVCSNGWMTYLTAAAGLFIALQACGGSSSDADDSDANAGPNVSAARADVVAMCDAICERETSCSVSDPADPPCEPQCLSDSPEATLLRRDVFRGLLNCQRQLTCDDNDDRCLVQVVQELVPDFASSPLLNRCVEIQDQCGGFSEDSCSYAIVFTDAGKARLETCLNETCELVAGCIAGLVQGT